MVTVLKKSSQIFSFWKTRFKKINLFDLFYVNFEISKSNANYTWNGSFFKVKKITVIHNLTTTVDTTSEFRRRILLFPKN